VWRVSTAVNNVRNDRPELLLPVALPDAPPQTDRDAYSSGSVVNNSG